MRLGPRSLHSTTSARGCARRCGAVLPTPVHCSQTPTRPPRARVPEACGCGTAAPATAAQAADQEIEPPGVSGRGIWTPPPERRGVYDASGRLVLKCLELSELEAWCESLGEEAPANRALQLWRWMYADPPAGAWIDSLEATLGKQNGFSQKFLDKISSSVSLDGGLRLKDVVRASDGTRKLLFELTGGEAKGGTIETVLIPVVRQKGLRDRLTVCVSSQVGCAMNCQFCFTGRMGLLGNLTTAQIVEQVVAARRFLAEEGDRTPLTNMVYMGMGEPLHNLDAVLSSVGIISHYLGLHISHNKTTISTVGLVPEMREVLRRTRAQVALSLHATTDEVRDWIVPVNRRYDLQTLMAALRDLFPKPLAAQPGQHLASASPAPAAAAASEAVAQQQQQEAAPAAQHQRPAGLPDNGQPSTTSCVDAAARVGDRTLLIEYVMLRGINDTREDANRLVDLLSEVNAKVNLIVFNPHAGTRFQSSLNDDVCAFRSILIQRGMVCTIRDSRGDDEMAACGQLGNVGLAFRPSPILEAPERFRHTLLPATTAGG